MLRARYGPAQLARSGAFRVRLYPLLVKEFLGRLLLQIRPGRNSSKNYPLAVMRLQWLSMKAVLMW